MSTKHVIAIVGATASGKTDVGERVARELGGEVVCADSRQVFHQLDIGTGKPSVDERASLGHHLFDALSLGETASAGWYAGAVQAVCTSIWERGCTPVLVGGSGLYLRAAREGLAATPPPDPAVRARLMEEMELQGSEAMHTRLRSHDPETAARLQPRDRQRIVRALEVFEGTQRPLSWWHRQEHATPTGDDWHVFELCRDPEEIRIRIAERTTWMFRNGLVDEARELLVSEHTAALRRLRAIGYDEAIAWIEGQTTRDAAETTTNHRTAQLAKRQRTWFRHQMQCSIIEEVEPGRAAQAIVATYAAAIG